MNSKTEPQLIWDQPAFTMVFLGSKHYWQVQKYFNKSIIYPNLEKAWEVYYECVARDSQIVDRGVSRVVVFNCSCLEIGVSKHSFFTVDQYPFRSYKLIYLNNARNNLNFVSKSVVLLFDSCCRIKCPFLFRFYMT